MPGFCGNRIAASFKNLVSFFFAFGCIKSCPGARSCFRLRASGSLQSTGRSSALVTLQAFSAITSTLQFRSVGGGLEPLVKVHRQHALLGV